MKQHFRTFGIVWSLLTSLVYGQPVAQFTASQTSGCSPLTVSFNNTSTGATSYVWSFGNGNNSDLTHPSANFITPGVYTVTLTARNGSATSTQSMNITVFRNPTANFTVSQTTGCVKDQICFTDVSLEGSAPITNWSWDFGDGNTSSDRNPCHAYAAAGTYTVVLVVTDQNGCTNNKMVTNAVRIGTTFTASFNQSNTQACAPPHNVNFNTTVSPAGTYTYAWDFGNGFNSTQPNPSTTYTQNGIYTVRVTVTSTTGCERVIEKPNLVRIGKPKAAFTADTVQGCQPLRVQFTNQTIPDSSNVLYFWQSSGGQTSTAKSPIFTYDLPGQYNVRLIARYTNGCADTLFVPNMIRVFKQPEADFASTKRTFCKVPAHVTFSALTSDTSIVSYLWNFGDSSFATGALVSKTYTNLGRYPVALTVTSRNGCVNRIAKNEFVIIEKPKPKVEVRELDGCYPREIVVRIKDESIVPVDRFTFIFNDTIRALNTLSNEIILTVYKAGKFLLRVRGSNQDSCETLDTFEIRTGLKLTPSFTPDRKTQCLKPGTVTFTNTTILPPEVDTAEIRWEWDFGNGSKSADKQPKALYIDTGRYVVSLKIFHRECYGDSLIAYDTIVILPPKVRMEHTDIVCDKDTIIFTDLTAGPIIRLWNSRWGNATTEHFFYIAAKNELDTVRLIVTDTVTQCRDTASVILFIPPKPKADFIASSTLICKPYRSQFIDITDYGSFIPDNILWRVYKDTTLIAFSSGIATPNDTFLFSTSETGTFRVKLTITNALGCKAEKEVENALRTVRLNAAFSLVASQGCIPFPATVVNESQADFPIRSIRWEWGNGKFDTTTNPVSMHTYLQPPPNQLQGYLIRMRITDSLGCTDTISRRVFPSRPPTNFFVTKSKFCTYDSVQFRWMPMGAGGISPYQFRWTIGDTVLSTVFNFSRSFTDELSTKKIKLVVTDARQCSDSLERFFIVDNRKPKADFIADPPFIECPGKPINLIDRSTRGATAIVAWNWNFGDNSRSVLQNPAKIYLLPNRYTVSLIIRDSAGCVDTATKYEFVIVNGPIAEYSVTPKIGCSPHTAQFVLSTKNTKTIEWDLGDGTIKNDSVFAYTYVSPRSYIPFLILSDSNNCRIGFPQKDTIIVHSTPLVNFEVSNHLLCTTETIILTNTSVHDKPLLLNMWQLGDSTFMEHARSFPIRFSKGGTYRLGLTVSDSLGCSHTRYIDPYFTVYDDIIPPLAPNILRTSVTSNESTLLEWNTSKEPDFRYYTLYYSYSEDQPLSQRVIPNLNDTVFFETGINTLNNTHSYQLTATDLCGNISDTSFLHRTINLTAEGVIFANKLRWNGYRGWKKEPKRYEVHKLNFITQAFEWYGEVPGNTTTFIDSGALCNLVSFYKIKAIYDDSSSLYSWSDTSGAVPLYQNIIPSPEHIRVTVVDNSAVLLQWKRKAHLFPMKTLIFRSTDDGNPIFITEMGEDDTAYFDEDVDVTKHSYTYITQHKDRCGGVSNGSRPSKTILLKALPISGNSFPIKGTISWNPYTHWENGIKNYTLYHGNERFNNAEEVARVAPHTLSYTHQIALDREDDYCYKVIAFATDSTHLYSESNIDCISTKPRLYAPNVFTINQDGVNETFRLGGYFIQTFRVEIYTRSGERVFESNDLTHSWDGTYNNTPCASDVYVYIATAIGYNGERIELSGTVTLLR